MVGLLKITGVELGHAPCWDLVEIEVEFRLVTLDIHPLKTQLNQENSRSCRRKKRAIDRKTNLHNETGASSEASTSKIKCKETTATQTQTQYLL